MSTHRLRPIERVPAYQAIVEQITQDVMGNRLRHEERLPSERELAEIFGVSRVVVREAMKALRTMGLVKIKPGAGTFVSIHPDRFISRSLNITLARETGSLFQLLELRKALESHTALLAAENATDDDLSKMAECLDRMRNAIDSKSIEDIHSADFSFHSELAQATHNPFMVALAKTVIALTKDGFRSIVGIVGPFERYFEEHQSVYEAIRKRKPQQAFARMCEHIDETASFLREMESQSLDSRQ